LFTLVQLYLILGVLNEHWLSVLTWTCYRENEYIVVGERDETSSRLQHLS